VALLPGEVGDVISPLAPRQQTCRNKAATTIECLSISLCQGILRQKNEFAIGRIIQIGE